MFFSSFLIALAITWLTAVVDTVIESARTGATELKMFGRALFQMPSAEAGVLIMCALSASATLAVVTAVAIARGRRLKRRMAEELSERIRESKLSRSGSTGLTTLLPGRVAELQTSVDTLTIRRNELLEDIKRIEESRARKAAAPVVEVPDTDTIVDVAALETGTNGNGIPKPEPAEPAGTA